MKLIDAEPVIKALNVLLDRVSPGDADRGFALEDALDIVEKAQEIPDDISTYSELQILARKAIDKNFLIGDGIVVERDGKGRYNISLYHLHGEKAKDLIRRMM